MSINNFSSDNQNNPWWTQQEHKNTPTSQLSWLHSQESSSMQHYNTNEDIETETNNSSQEQQYQHPQEVQEFQKRTMFEKPLTPSDVGKLNRLVIPKQHAEKHFPLSGDSIDKGLLLSFEDELGKSWKFRYSYWNSSQSYVLTKGWSRYVKEKSLDAGDVVFFARHRMDSERLFIGWRRRGTVSANAAAPPQDGGALATYNSGGGGDGGWSRMMVRAGQGYPYPRQHQHGHGAHVPYQSDSMHAESVVQHHQITAATTSSSGSRTLRLFGVNLECQLEESEPSTPDSSSWSSQSQGHTYHHQMQQYYSQLYNSSHQSHMDISFCEDGKQMRDHRG